MILVLGIFVLNCFFIFIIIELLINNGLICVYILLFFLFFLVLLLLVNEILLIGIIWIRYWLVLFVLNVCVLFEIVFFLNLLKVLISIKIKGNNIINVIIVLINWGL